MVRSRVIVASVLLVLVVSNAWGESALFGPSNRTRHWEFSIQTRYVGSQSFDGSNGSSLSVEDDLGWGFGLGYNINEHFVVSGLVSWRSVDYSAHVVTTDLQQSFDYSGWLDTANTALSGTYNVLANRFTPYLQGSVGWAMLDTNIPSSLDMDCWWDPWWGYVCLESGTTFGEDAASFTLGGGLSWQLSNAFWVRAGYEKLWVDIDTADDFDIFRLDMGFLYR